MMPPDIRYLFPKDCQRIASDIDHIYADVLESDKLSALTAGDGAHLSKECHAIKTATDQKVRAKRNRHSVRKDRPKSGWFRGAKTQWPKGSKLQSRGFPKPTGKKEKAAKIGRGKATDRGSKIP
jgi:hypothetical protein